MTITKNTLLAVVSSVTAFSGWAQDNTTATNGDNLVVTANRFPQPVSSVLAPTTIVTRNDIDRWQAKSLTDVMRRLPGVDVGQNGGLGQKSSLFIRGTNSSHVLVLIDGIRLNQAGVSGSSDLSQIPISLVQKVEYIRGPRSEVSTRRPATASRSVVVACVTGEAGEKRLRLGEPFELFAPVDRLLTQTPSPALDVRESSTTKPGAKTPA